MRQGDLLAETDSLGVDVVHKRDDCFDLTVTIREVLAEAVLDFDWNSVFAIGNSWHSTLGTSDILDLADYQFASYFNALQQIDPSTELRKGNVTRHTIQNEGGTGVFYTACIDDLGAREVHTRLKMYRAPRDRLF